MPSRMKRIKELLDHLDKLFLVIKEIYNFTKEEKDEELKYAIREVIVGIMNITLTFYDYLRQKTLNSYKKDLVDIQFKDIIKDLEKDEK